MFKVDELRINNLKVLLYTKTMKEIKLRGQ